MLRVSGLTVALGGLGGIVDLDWHARLSRGERLQAMLSPEELKVIDNWRFEARMPTRAAAIRELLKRGLRSAGLEIAEAGQKSSEFGVVGAK